MRSTQGRFLSKIWFIFRRIRVALRGRIAHLNPVGDVTPHRSSQLFKDMITVLVADDHCLVRKAICAALRREPGLQVAGEADDGWETIRLVGELKPEVLLLDLSLPRVHGIDVIQQVKRDSKTRVVVLTMHGDQSYVIEAFKAGASGYVLKDSPTDEVFQAIRSVAAGGNYVAVSLQKQAIKRSILGAQDAQSPVEKLSLRERLVLELAAEGLSNAEIAGRLYLSVRTVESHRSSILKKLALNSQTDLVRFAIRNDIVPL